MTLKPCSECGEEVSSQASECPNCGAPTSKGRWQSLNKSAGNVGCLLTLLVVIPLALMATCMG